jgi:hypothetical protein
MALRPEWTNRFHPEDGGRAFVQNFGSGLPEYAVPDLRRKQSHYFQMMAMQQYFEAMSSDLPQNLYQFNGSLSHVIANLQCLFACVINRSNYWKAVAWIQVLIPNFHFRKSSDFYMDPFTEEHHKYHIDFQRNKFSKLLKSLMLTMHQSTQMERWHYNSYKHHKETDTKGYWSNNNNNNKTKHLNETDVKRYLIC